MSRLRRRRDALREVAKLRGLVENHARSNAVVAELRKQEAVRQRAREGERLQASVDGWSAAQAAVAIGPELVASWSSQVVLNVERLAAAERACVEQDRHYRTAQQELTKAQAERDCARQLSSEAERRYASWRNERTIGEIADSFSSRTAHIRDGAHAD